MVQFMSSFQIQIIYAGSPEHCWAQTLDVEPNTTISDAISQSDFSKNFPDLDWQSLGLGIYGIKQTADYCLHPGDRLELYRGLNFDPKISRKRRAIHRKAGILKKKHLKPDRSKRIEFDDYTQETK